VVVLGDEDARSDMAFKAETGVSANRLCTGPDTLSNSPLIRASLLATKESRLSEPISFLRPIHNRQPCGALDKASDKARGHYQSPRNKSQLMRSFMAARC
jgi:hypothetical protein